jgi:hypothetical protein
MHRFVSAGCVAMVLLALSAPAARGVELGAERDRFTIDGKPTFLLGCSYYAGLGAPEGTARSDLDELHRLGFNWIRVFADWTAYETDLSAVDAATGQPRQPSLQALVRLCDECNRRGMIVDVTLARGTGVGGRPCLHDLPAHRRAVETLVNALQAEKNWYLDLSNERNIRDSRYTSITELAALRSAARALNPRLLVTASHGGDASRDEVEAYLKTAHLDFVSIHRPRDAHAARQGAEMTRQYRAWIREIGSVVPLQYDEPFRRGYGSWEPTAADFQADLQACRRAGAAGWCFHNGDTHATPDRQPRRSFDLKAHTLFEQLDAEERKFLAHVQSMSKPPISASSPDEPAGRAGKPKPR